jgi:hypothetical protein
MSVVKHDGNVFLAGVGCGESDKRARKQGGELDLSRCTLRILWAVEIEGLLCRIG